MSASTVTGSSNLLCVAAEGVVYLTLNRPEKRNALSQDTLRDLEAELTRIAADASARVVVFGSKGPVFCTGHDLGEMPGRSEGEYHDLFALCSRVMTLLRRLPQPVIARVQGLATAAGCQLVAACDLAVASEEAAFATPGVKIGLFCTTPMVPLVRAIPAKPALEMLLTGKPISAQRPGARTGKSGRFRRRSRSRSGRIRSGYPVVEPFDDPRRQGRVLRSIEFERGDGVRAGH